MSKLNKPSYQELEQRIERLERSGKYQGKSLDTLEEFFSHSLDGFYYVEFVEPVAWKGDGDKDNIIDDVFLHQSVATVNTAFLDMVGYSRDELIGLKLAEFGSSDPSEGKQRLRELFDVGSLHYESEMKKSDSSILSIDGNAILTRNSECEITGYYNVIRDITKKKIIEDILKKREEQFRSLAENSEDYIIRYDAQCRHLYQNRSAYRVSGFTEEEFVGKTHRELGFDESLCETWEKKITQVFQTKEATGEIFEWEGEQGTVTLDWRVYPEFGENGEVQTVLGVSRDITEQKNLEKKLRQSQKMEALGTLAGGIAHDFNNILGSVLGNAELLLAKLPEDSHERRYLERITLGGERAANLVRQILTFSRMESTQFKSVNIGPVVDDALKIARATIPANVEIRQSIKADGTHIMADATQIHQIILNLCTNAYHAMEGKAGVVDVSLRELDQCPPGLSVGDGSCLELSVEDTGSGIASRDQPKIFDPFFTSKKIGKGTGLGLSVVHGIVENHNGKIGLSSTVGKGTAISIFFPITKDKNREIKVESSLSQDDSVYPRSRHILIVEDEPQILQLYKQFLESSGYTVDVCGDGESALTLFKNNPTGFDLILTDQAMPNLTGKELAKEVLGIRPGIPVIVSTGYSEEFTKEEAYELGVRKYLMKPVKLKSLKQSIEKCLD